MMGAHFHIATSVESVLASPYCTYSLQNTSLHCGTLSLRLVEDDLGTAFDHRTGTGGGEGWLWQARSPRSKNPIETTPAGVALPRGGVAVGMSTLVLHEVRSTWSVSARLWRSAARWSPFPTFL